jgi:hypothetical protein
MKKISLVIVVSIVTITFSCSQNNVIQKNVSDSTLLLNLKKCNHMTFGSETVTLCLDSIIADSRCPKNVVCIWAGTAIAKFSFSNSNTKYPVTLSTTKFGSYSSDTVLSGYKIKFIDLSPYPGTFIPPVSTDQIKAEVQIVKQ